MRQGSDVDHLGAALVAERLKRLIWSHSDKSEGWPGIIGIAVKNAPAALPRKWGLVG